MTDRELLQKLLYYMDDGCGPYTDDYQKLIEAIRARLSQCDRCGEVNPAEIHTCTPQEPVAWGIANTRPTEKKPLMVVMLDEPEPSHLVVPLYTVPPQREWQGLTDEEVFAALVAVDGNTKRLAPGFVAFYCAIEAALKAKNG